VIEQARSVDNGSINTEAGQRCLKNGHITNLEMGCDIEYDLPSMTLYLVRHASAGTRGSLGPHNDLTRTLDQLGHDQAAHVVELLGERGVERIYSSGAVRCVETVEPLRTALGLDVEVHEALLEGQSATMAIHLARSLATDHTTAVLCSHGDIIPDMVQTLAREGMIIVGQRAWAKGSTWEIRTRGGDLTEAHFLGPY